MKMGTNAWGEACQILRKAERHSVWQWEQFVKMKLRRVLLLGFALLAWSKAIGQPNETNTISQDELMRLIYAGQIARITELNDGNGGIYLRKDYLTRPEHEAVSKKYFGLFDNVGPHYYFIVPHGSSLPELITKLQYENPYQEKIIVSPWYENDSPSEDTPNFLFIGLSIVIGLIYFIPSIIGYPKHNATAIIALNILLGWTFVGWVVALVWALTKERNDNPDNVAVLERKDHQTNEPKGLVDELERLYHLKEKGILTDAEFQQQKERLLNE